VLRCRCKCIHVTFNYVPKRLVRLLQTFNPSSGPVTFPIGARQITVSTPVVKGSSPWASSFFLLCRTAGEMRSRGIRLTSGTSLYPLHTKCRQDTGRTGDTKFLSTPSSVAMAFTGAPILFRRLNAQRTVSSARICMSAFHLNHWQ
jgi:hypothetical protein